MFKRLANGELKPTTTIIQLADRLVTYPRGIIEGLILRLTIYTCQLILLS